MSEVNGKITNLGIYRKDTCVLVMKTVRLIKKYFEYVHTKIKVMYKQKKFCYDGVILKYMCNKVKTSDTLVIVFSACTRQGVPARYNYVRTLEKTDCNKLYILDDFGEDGRGSYYLGHMPEFIEQEATIELIKNFIYKLKPGKVIFCGSCKGGYAALNIGSRFKDSIMIIGEPTYKIATEFKLADGLLRYWMGEVTEDNIKYVDNYLTKQLEHNKFKDSQKIHIFYSTCDEYVERHTKPLLDDLRNFGYCLEEENDDFSGHADLGLYFADYLKRKVQDIIIE